jgi:hypothetical protein
VQYARFSHQQIGDVIGLRDGDQLFIKHAGKGKQVVALVLQRDTYRANVSGIFRLALPQVLDNKVEQRLPCGQSWPSECQNVMAQPLSERSDVAGQPMRCSFVLPRNLQLDDKFVTWTRRSATTRCSACPPGG